MEGWPSRRCRRRQGRLGADENVDELPGEVVISHRGFRAVRHELVLERVHSEDSGYSLEHIDDEPEQDSEPPRFATATGGKEGIGLKF
jgi:hypothetical protein